MMGIVPAIAAIVFAVLIVMALLVWLLPRQFAARYKLLYGLENPDLAKLESETRTAMVQLAVGLAGFLVLWTAVESIEATNKNLDLANKNLDLATQTQLAERFSKAVALVSESGTGDRGNDSGIVDSGIVARVAGVYALASIMESGDKFYLRPSIHVLAAMARRQSPKENAKTSCTGLDDEDVNPYGVPVTQRDLDPDVDAALQVILREAAEEAAKGGNLASGLNLSHADLCIAYMDRAMFRGVQMRNSDLRGSILDHADLTRAALSGADLRGAHLPAANLKDAFLEDARLDMTDLSCADLSGADLNGATLVDANLSWANLRSARNLVKGQLSAACYTKDVNASNQTKDPGHPLLPLELKDFKVEECGSARHARELKDYGTELARRGSMWSNDHKPFYVKSCPKGEVAAANGRMLKDTSVVENRYRGPNILHVRAVQF